MLKYALSCDQLCPILARGSRSRFPLPPTHPPTHPPRHLHHHHHRRLRRQIHLQTRLPDRRIDLDRVHFPNRPRRHPPRQDPPWQTNGNNTYTGGLVYLYIYVRIWPRCIYTYNIYTYKSISDVLYTGTCSRRADVRQKP